MAAELNQEQYNLLISCSEKGDFTEWNNFVSNFEGIIRLRFGDFSGLHLIGAKFISKNPKGADLFQANFENANIEGIDFSNAFMMEANLKRVKGTGLSFYEADLVKTNFEYATFELVDFSKANFQEANLSYAKFIASDFYETCFQKTNVENTHFLSFGYDFIAKKEKKVNFCGARFYDAKFNNGTYFGPCSVSIETDFRSVTFESANYAQGLRQTLQYCNRRHNWCDWYEKQGHLTNIVVRSFWSYSDYGSSISKIVKSFFSVCVIFALIYFLFPSLIENLEHGHLIRSVYFSIVTMTTLGFGDMHASETSWIAQCLVMAQVLYGYVLLGALVTALSNLFSSDGPAQGLVVHPEKSNMRLVSFNEATRKK